MFHGAKLCFFVVFLLLSCFPLKSTGTETKSSIRVLLGRFSFPYVKAENLKINSEYVGWSGTWEWKLNCGRDSEGAFIRLGKETFPSPVFLESVGGFIALNNTNYRGSFYIYENKGKCMVVNHVAVEDYLPGVLGKEMGKTWPIEALKAQSIAARSYALHKRKKSTHPHYDIFSSVQDQVYGGQSSESKVIRKAVKATQGIVLVFKNRLLQAFYHSSCGGETNVPLDVWGKKHPAYRSVFCPAHSTYSNKKEWVYRTNLHHLEYQLRKHAVLPKSFLRLAKLSKLKKTPNKLLLADVSGKKLFISSSKLRSSIGFDQIRSSKFAIHREEKETLSFYGRGYGHAVGMCQYGAKAMALNKKSYESILYHYYPLASLRKVY